MSQSTHPSPTQYGRIRPPDEAWLAKAAPEPILEPDLPIVDTHHHLWVRPDHRYLLDELLADLRTGHNVVATVFLECHSMYRADGPAEMRPVGETEFVAGIAAMSDSGQYGATRIAAGIVGFADLALGDRVEPVLQAHIRAGGGRFRGVRHSAAWDASPIIGTFGVATGPHDLQRKDFRAGLARLTALGLSFDAWVFHPQLADAVDLARSAPRRQHHRGPRRRTARLRALRRQARRGLRRLEGRDARAGHVPERDHEARRHDDAPGRLRLRGGAGAARHRELAARWRPYIELCIERFGATRCMFESNFPVDKMGIGYAALWNALKRIAAGASAEEKLALFSGTARRVYRLE